MKTKRHGLRKGAAGQAVSLRRRALTAPGGRTIARAPPLAPAPQNPSREDAATRREEVADRREEATDLREDAMTVRETALRVRELTARAKAQLSTTEAQLREANEHLVVASVLAQTMTDAAEQTSAQMSHLAEHDFLTGLPNRSLLTDRLAQAIALAQRHHGKKVALLYLDLDHFKHINDTLGHAVGDQLLQSAAKRLLACVRHSDTVSRQGGDEFVVLLSEVDEVNDATRIADKLIRSMAEPHLIGGHRLHVTLSVGISHYPDDAKDLEAVVRNADTAMYHAKRSGRNNYQVFSRDIAGHETTRQSVAQTLHHALDQHEFVLHYQPKVALETGVITGAEALLRLQRAGHEVVGPAKFLGIAGDSGLLLPIGNWVRREACRQAQAWLQAGLPLGQISVNVSTAEFRSQEFVAGLRAVLAETGLDPSLLEIELGEGGLMQNTEQTTAILHALKELGVRIAIDGFGTGHSSLGDLRRFPVDTLKIDRSLMKDLDGESMEAIIVNAIIAMGKTLHQRVVAEGIETQPQLAFLQSRHCAEGQGYFFSPPVAAESFTALLASGGRY